MVKRGSGRTGRKPTEKILAYIAGLFDGEGCIWYAGVLRVSITSCYPHHLRDIQNVLGIGRFRMLHPRMPDQNKRSCFRWQASGADAVYFLELIIDFLKEKGYQARLGLTLYRYPKRSLTHASALAELKSSKKVNY